MGKMPPAPTPERWHPSGPRWAYVQSQQQGLSGEQDLVTCNDLWLWLIDLKVTSVETDK